MYKFEITEAKILHNVIFNNENVFLVVEANNGKYYQIKLPTYFSNPVTKEFLANYIAQILNFPVPNVAFIKMSKNFLSELSIYYPEILEKVSNLNSIKEITFFAIEWIKNTLEIDDEEMLKEIVKNIIFNQEEFYSVYAFDMLLCNFDRHFKNFIVDNEKYEILFIDHERSFGSFDYSELENHITYDGCIYSYPQISYLYEIIKTEEQFEYIINFAKQIDKLNLTKEVFEIFNRNSSNKFEFGNDDIKNRILNYFKKRTNNISNYMIKNKKVCFDAIS